MKNVKPLLLAATIAVATLHAVVVLAQARPDQSKVAGATTETSKDMTDGEVRKVDMDTGKVTIKHGEIKNLGMPPMTMVFNVRQKAMLAKVKAGDKVRFSVVDENGKMTVTEIRTGN